MSVGVSINSPPILGAFLLLLIIDHTNCFWDVGTTTPSFIRTDDTPRQSFFRRDSMGVVGVIHNIDAMTLALTAWQITQFENLSWWFSNWDWYTIRMNRRLRCICGISIDMLPLGTATLMNRRTLITSANYLEPYMNRQKDIRIWCLGREGIHTTPYRYRVWRIRRLLPKSLNPEHWHGQRGVHSPRHDVVVIHSFDQIYVYNTKSTKYHYPHRAMLTKKHDVLGDELWFAGSGYEYLTHISENYKIFFANQTRDEIVDCSRYLPKWWGKFICISNSHGFPGVPNGGGLFVKGKEYDDDDFLVGVGCFEIRYNEERIMAFTDLRYYVDWLNIFANITRGEYYEYAYPQWSISLGWWDSSGNTPYIPRWQVKRDMFPLG